MSETMESEGRLVHAYLLDGTGGGRRLELAEIQSWTPGQGMSHTKGLWIS